MSSHLIPSDAQKEYVGVISSAMSDKKIEAHALSNMTMTSDLESNRQNLSSGHLTEVLVASPPCCEQF